MRLDSTSPARLLAGSPPAPASRAQAQQRVGACRSWAELFDAANLALSHDRRAWGDALAPSCAAFALWRSAAFVVAASQSVEMDATPQGSTMRAEGLALARASFACARALAAHLLAPMPFDPTDPPGSHRLFSRACSQARQDVDRRLGALRDSCALGPRLSLAMPTPKGQCINLLVGTACWIAIDEPNLLLQRAALPTWDALSASARLDFPSHPGSERLAWAQAETQWRAALESGPFAYLACGPDGGAAQAGAEAAKLTRAADLFSSELRSCGMPILGLAGLGAYVNARPVGDMASAAFENSRFDLVFKAPFHPTFLHHEWTHALDQMTQANQSAFPNAAEALAELRREMASGARDEPTFEAEIERASRASAEARDALSSCAEIWGQARSLAHHPNGSPDASWAAQEAFRLALDAANPSRFGYLPTIQSIWIEPQDPAMDPALAARANQSLVKTRSSRRELDSLLASRSSQCTSFLAVAESLEAANPDSKGYWTHAPEMLARTGEGRFCPLLPTGLRTPDGRIVIAGKPSIEHPMGAERQRLSLLFDRWLAASGPMVEQAATERARHGILPQAPAQMMRMGSAPR